MVDGPDVEMTDGAARSKSGGVFVHALDDVAEMTVVGSERVSSGLTDVVVALSAGEKGDGSLPSFAVDEEPTANPAGLGDDVERLWNELARLGTSLKVLEGQEDDVSACKQLVGEGGASWRCLDAKLSFKMGQKERNGVTGSIEHE
ncbi:hypothetical protein Tco_1109033 [Tanacetum coccineum]